MLTWFFNRSPTEPKAAELYGAVVALARRPKLYEVFGVADTPEGRYEALVLHLFLAAERLMAEGEQGSKHAQALIEAFVTDMDDNMREMGVGDLSVPKKVKKAAAAFYDRADVYRSALAAEGSEELAGALVRLVPAADDRAFDAGAFAADVREQAARLAAIPLGGLISGNPAS